MGRLLRLTERRLLGRNRVFCRLDVLLLLFQPAHLLDPLPLLLLQSQPRRFLPHLLILLHFPQFGFIRIVLLDHGLLNVEDSGSAEVIERIKQIAMVRVGPLDAIELTLSTVSVGVVSTNDCTYQSRVHAVAPFLDRERL